MKVEYDFVGCLDPIHRILVPGNVDGFATACMHRYGKVHGFCCFAEFILIYLFNT